MKKRTWWILRLLLCLCILLTTYTPNTEKGRAVSYFSDSDDLWLRYELSNGDSLSMYENTYSRTNVTPALGKFRMDGCEVEFLQPQIYQCGPGSTGRYYLFMVTPVDLSNADESWLNQYFLLDSDNHWNFQYDVYAEGIGSFKKLGIYYDAANKAGYIVNAHILFSPESLRKEYSTSPYTTVNIRVNFENVDCETREFVFTYDHMKHSIAYSDVRIGFAMQATAPFQHLRSAGEPIMDYVCSVFARWANSSQELENFLKILE